MYFPNDIWRIIKQYKINFNPTLKRLDYQYSMEACLEDFDDITADEYTSDTDTDTSGYYQINKTVIQIHPKLYFMITNIRFDNEDEDEDGELISIETPDNIIKTIYSICKKTYKLDKKINNDMKICYILHRPTEQRNGKLHYMLWRRNQDKTIRLNDLPAILDEFYVNLIKTEILKNLVNHYTYS